MPGILSLRRIIADVDKNHYSIEWNPDTEITITAGATEALYDTIIALCNPGDEVIAFEPFYDAYQANVQLAGGVLRLVTLKKPNFSFDFAELENAISSKTKLLILNNPNNPTGKVYSRDELEFIASLAIKNDFFVLSDEVYEYLTYDNVRHIPVSTIEGMRNRTITISSTGKTFSMTGWKIGYIRCCPPLTEAIRKVHQWTTFAVNTPAQHAMAHAFSRLDSYLPDFRKMYKAKRDLLYSLLLETKFCPHQAYGSYFIMVDIPNDSAMKDMQWADLLVKQYGIATIPTSVFYCKSNEGETLLRLCFAKSDDTIRSGAEKLKTAI